MSACNGRIPGAGEMTGPVDGVPLVVLSGLAGAGKTQLLQALHRIGHPVLDLEGLAGHHGSAFGGLGRPAQPSRASFLATLSGTARALPRDVAAWVEDEGPFIGSLPVPDWLQEAIRRAPEVQIVAPQAARISRLAATYGHLPAAQLIAATRRMRRRLGDERTDAAIGCFAAGDPEAAITILLAYFDSAYGHRAGQRHRRRLRVVDSSSGSPAQLARLLADAASDVAAGARSGSDRRISD